jgi:polysaccharide biosynthesis/export protein
MNPRTLLVLSLVMLGFEVLTCSAQELVPPVEKAIAAPGNVSDTAGFQSRNPLYTVGPGDIFDANFEYTPEFNQTVTVRPDGYVTLREVGDVFVQGANPQELTARMRKAYAGILNDPVIAIVLKDFQKPYFIVDGQVKQPGRYELRGVTTVAQAIAVAGGLTEAAKHSEILLVRHDPGSPVRKLNLKQMLQQASFREDPELHPGDSVYVPQSLISKLKGWLVPRASIGPSVRITP